MAYTAPAPQIGMAGNLRSRTHHGFGMFWDVLSVLFLSTIWGSHNGSKVLIKSPKIWGTDEFEAKVCELFGASQRGGGAMGWSYRHRGSDSDCSNVDHYVFVPIVVKKSPFQSQSLVQSPWATCIPTYHWSPFHKKSTSTWLRGLI